MDGIRWKIHNNISGLIRERRHEAKYLLVTRRKDYVLLRTLRIYLKFLEEYHNIAVFIDDALESGDIWLARIREKIANCNVGLLFLSQRYFLSKFIQGEELTPLLNRANANEIILVPIIGEDIGRRGARILGAIRRLTVPTDRWSACLKMSDPT